MQFTRGKRPDGSVRRYELRAPCSDSECELENCKSAGEPQDDADESIRNQHGRLDRLVVNIVLDHRLQAELHMVRRREDK